MNQIRISSALLSILCLLSAAPAKPADSCQYKNMREAIATITAREEKHEWQKINWRTNSSKALAEAQTQSKPIFVFFVVNQKKASPKQWVGKKNDDKGKT